MRLTSGEQQQSPPFPVSGPRRFDHGQLVEVLDKSRNVWMPAVVVLSWVETDLTGKRSFLYNCAGEDELGPFHGRWDHLHIRERLATEAAQPAGGNAR